MSGKVFAAGVICTLLACGAVYYGADAAGFRDKGWQPRGENAGDFLQELVQSGRDKLAAWNEPSTAFIPGTPTDPVAAARAARNKAVPIQPRPGVKPSDDPLTPFYRLIDEAQKIEIVDGRDDAFLNILNLALSQDRIDVSLRLVDMLSTRELRDTARQRIGVTHALNGRTQEAFAIIETLEIEALSDPIRLEIIRAATRVPQTQG